MVKIIYHFIDYLSSFELNSPDSTSKASIVQFEVQDFLVVVLPLIYFNYFHLLVEHFIAVTLVIVPTDYYYALL
jgi:hypothetical protein